MNSSYEISIWAPRYKDRSVLIAKHKVHPHNVIAFTRAKHLAGISYYMGGAKIKTYPLESNGKIPCYCIPLDDLEVV